MLDIDDNVRLPEPRRWESPITEEQYRALAPEGLDMVDGFLLGPEDSDDARSARLNLLALLLTNCGLEEAMWLAHPDDWRDAWDRAGLNA